jgi:SAM-dependent methyltransferase
MYTDLASWFHLLTAPHEYKSESDLYTRIMADAALIPVHTLLELGSGGGNMASHYKARFEATLTDLAPEMLALSKTINPELEHIQADMRTMRLGRQFDAVFIHDAVMYQTTADDLKAAIRTAFKHCRPGGVALFTPDYVKESYAPRTDCGGNDDGAVGLRYLEWTYDPDPDDCLINAEYAYIRRHADGSTTCDHERHVCGVFARQDWLDWLTEAGFQARAMEMEIDEEPGFRLQGLLGVRPLG